MSTANVRMRQPRGERRPPVVGLGSALLLVLLFAQPLEAATRYDPRLRFRTLVTPHFNIYYHQGEEALARRLARVAEDVAAQLTPRLGRPTGRVHVILVDQSDLANGWATPVPYNTIEITAASPRSASIIGNTDDWLRLVFSHEYTHILHLDRSRGLFSGLRKVFGRLPVVYPNLFVPLWQIEGIATYEESSLTGRGRLSAGEFREILDRAAGAGRFAPLDRASTLQIDWPSGNTPYLYGGYFHQYLAERFGPDSLRRLTDATAGRIPYFSASAFRKVFGHSLGDLWQDFEKATTSAKASKGHADSTRLTRHGFNVTTPRFAADGRLFYSVANPHGFPALMELPRDGSAPRQIVTRYLGNRLTAADSLLVFDQVEVVRSVGLVSDLYAVSADTRESRRLTRDARVADPDLAPDGRTIVCTIQLTDRRALGTLTMPPERQTATVSVLVSEPFTDFASPRWSPDGRMIAAERRRLGGPSELVRVDANTAEVRVVVTSAEGRNVDPVWSPNARALLFASDREGPFQLHAVDMTTGRITRMPEPRGGAKAPEISPDGRTLVYVGYTPDGYDLFSVPFDINTWVGVIVPVAPAPGAVLPTAETANTAIQERAYTPWPTALPHFWYPVVEDDDGETVIGAATAGGDALGRHGYAASAVWSVSRARPDWTAGYTYDRWRPTLFASVSDDTDPWRDDQARTREAEFGAVLPFRRVRWRQVIVGSFHGSSDAFRCHACASPATGTVNRRSLRGAWRFNSVKTYGYSISPEEGTSVAAALELTRRALGADGNAGAATFDARQYAPIRPRHSVLAARGAIATAWGEGDVRRQFTAAGEDPPPGGFGFEIDTIGLLRGFEQITVIGRHAAVINVDYRVPLLRVERGVSTWPVFLRAVHAALFADAGHAWNGTFRSAEARASVGGELSIDTIVGYSLPLTLSTGVAWRIHGPRDERGVVAFGRIGRAF